MIVVEGPDNSGKSTLIKWIKEEFPVREIRHGRHGPPLSALEIKARTEIILREAIKFRKEKETIVDRFSLIGESIYQLLFLFLS